MPGSTLNYTYNDEGIKTATNTPYGNFSYSYDNANRLTGITNHKGESFGFIYDNANRLKQINRPGSKTVISVDDNGFLTNIDHLKTNNNPISQFAYTRDALGNRTSVTNTFGSKNFGYDNLNQLTSASNSEASGDYLNEVFTYDNLGNRLSSSSGSYNYDPKKARITSDYKYNYVHDNDGNLTIRQDKANTTNFTNYNYNSENQLTSIEEYTNNSLIKTHSYFYDAVGRRYKKEITDHINTSNSYERKYIYDNQEILSELDEDDNTLAVYTHSMLRTDDVLAVDVKDTKIASLGSYFFTKDAIGSISEIVDSSGSLIQRYVYSSFGKVLKIADSAGSDITSNPLIKTSYGFTNREHDESGLMYFRARYMMNEIGRFMQEDPVSGRLINPSSVVNLYLYALNNSINRVDPSGKFPPDTHGYYCGNSENKAPQKGFRPSGGYDSYGNPIGSPLKPVDKLDEACYSHDQLYSSINDWFEFGNPNLTFDQSKSEFTLAKRGVDHALASLFKGDIGGFVSGTGHTAFGVVTGAWSLTRTIVGVNIKIAEKILGVFGVKF
ncbi:MAG: hypothetical protein N4A33_10155 [Bacteriovoracaceae bacterium]|jgi:RHS repeat-associated protein|nr:hypothetical protein [Bacteriovoracaceae bacterium]